MGILGKLFKKRDNASAFNEFDAYFFLGKKLGSGAFAVVHEAIRKEDSKHFAVKIISKAKLKDQFDAVVNEIDILRHVKHRHIISLEDLYETKEKYYLVMDLATGGELFERILKKGSYTEKDAAKLIHQLLLAIKYLHDDCDIVHRDLKPENLLFRDPSDDCDILITDFGLSKYLKDHEFTSTTCGSPHYVAPEVLKHSGHGKPVDMWAIGVITYVLLCGYTPFWGGEQNSQQYLYQCIVSAKYKFDPEYWDVISEDAKSFISKLLLVKPEKRMTAGQALNHAWLKTQNQVDLLPNVAQNFNAKRAFKRAAIAVMGVVNMRSLSDLHSRSSTSSVNSAYRRASQVSIGAVSQASGVSSQASVGIASQASVGMASQASVGMASQASVGISSPGRSSQASVGISSDGRPSQTDEQSPLQSIKGVHSPGSLEPANDATEAIKNLGISDKGK